VKIISANLCLIFEVIWKVVALGGIFGITGVERGACRSMCVVTDELGRGALGSQYASCYSKVFNKNCSLHNQFATFRHIFVCHSHSSDWKRGCSLKKGHRGIFLRGNCKRIESKQTRVENSPDSSDSHLRLLCKLLYCGPHD
jgi:hypothetical protein